MLVTAPDVSPVNAPICPGWHRHMRDELQREKVRQGDLAMRGVGKKTVQVRHGPAKRMHRGPDCGFAAVRRPIGLRGPRGLAGAIWSPHAVLSPKDLLAACCMTQKSLNIK